MRVLAILACACLALAACATARNSQQLAAIFDQGVAAYDAGRYEEAYKIWSTIEDEDLAAARNVAMMLRRGKGVKKDPKAAEDLYMQAAQAGLPTAQADLADMLLKGEAGPPDAKAALPLLEAAAKAHHPLAQYELGQLYEAGEVVPKDTGRARELYAAAAARGVKEAGDRLAALGPASEAP
jgi:uncharacterized protein